jgi:hypothetical protein
MKTAALLASLALACGTAFAAQDNNAATTRDTQTTPSGGAVVDKTKNTLHRMGDKVRGAGHRVANAVRRSNDRADNHPPGSNTDTRSMGAPGSDTADTARRARMDDAYDNYKSKQR